MHLINQMNQLVDFVVSTCESQMLTRWGRVVAVMILFSAERELYKDMNTETTMISRK